MSKGKGNPYAGEVKNTGNQVVEAPFKATSQNKSSIKKGGDLRCGK